MLPRLSLIELTDALVSFHPTTTTFKFPAVCAAGYGTTNDDPDGFAVL